MRVIFMGTPDFAVGTLESLVQAGHDVCLAVTQPDKPRGRGKEMQFTPVKEAAAWDTGISAGKGPAAGMCGRAAGIQGGCHCGGGFRTDPSEGDTGHDAVRLY